MKLLCRLFVDAPLAPHTSCVLDEAHTHYLLHTLRAEDGQEVLLFNGRDGEWRAGITRSGKRELIVTVVAQTRVHYPAPDVHLLFAPVKNEKLDFLVMRATEMGVSALYPIVTARTIVSRVNLERMRRNLIEAAQQCERCDVPVLHPPQPLASALGQLGQRLLVHADESGEGKSIRAAFPALSLQAVSVLTGPEGGFSPEERRMIAAVPHVVSVGMGPRILRAETAVIAVLAHVQAWLGDGDIPPRCV